MNHLFLLDPQEKNENNHKYLLNAFIVMMIHVTSLLDCEGNYQHMKRSIEFEEIRLHRFYLGFINKIQRG